MIILFFPQKIGFIFFLLPPLQQNLILFAKQVEKNEGFVSNANVSIPCKLPSDCYYRRIEFNSIELSRMEILILTFSFYLCLSLSDSLCHIRCQSFANTLCQQKFTSCVFTSVIRWLQPSIHQTYCETTFLCRFLFFFLFIVFLFFFYYSYTFFFTPFFYISTSFKLFLKLQQIDEIYDVKTLLDNFLKR